MDLFVFLAVMCLGFAGLVVTTKYRER